MVSREGHQERIQAQEGIYCCQETSEPGAQQSTGSLCIWEPIHSCHHLPKDEWTGHPWVLCIKAGLCPETHALDFHPWLLDALLLNGEL